MFFLYMFFPPAPPQVRAANAPYVFVTNQGWLSEADRADLLSRQLGVPVPADACVLAHSALAEDAATLNPGLVLVTGRCRTDAAAIVRGYGYVNVRSVEAYSAALPHLNPLKHSGVGGVGDPPPPDTDAGDAAANPHAWARQPVRAIFLVETPADWHDDLQILVDVLRSDGVPGRAVPPASPTPQPVAFYCCNFDFLFAAEHPVPRFGPGAFLEALKALYARATGGRALTVVAHGKPHRPAYTVAEHKLARRAAALMAAGGGGGGGGTTAAPPPSPPPFRHIYAVGDNPASDVRGANGAGGAWRSVLVRSGVWDGRGKDNDAGDPAHFVCDDVGSAVDMILKAEGVVV
jgi:HAD superfamily hydrolase (TIGR01456 family)